MSEFFTHVVTIEALERHPNADTLSIATVLGGYPCIVKNDQFKVGDKAIYISVDALVPVILPEFAFLNSSSTRNGYSRIKAKRLRGIFSMGLLMPCPDRYSVGDNVAEAYGILKYEHPSEREPGQPNMKRPKTVRGWFTGETVGFDLAVTGIALLVSALVGLFIADAAVFALAALAMAGLAVYAMQENRANLKRPKIPYYDLEGLRKHARVFVPGEDVHVTEKIHGMNACFVHNGRKFHARSRTVFRIGKDQFTHVAEKHDLEKKLKQHPNKVVFGEVYGVYNGKHLQDLTYGKDDAHLAVFDVLDLTKNEYLSVGELVSFCRELDLPTVPTLYYGPYDHELIETLAEGKTVVEGATHVREGVVVKPLQERHDRGLGRVILKMAGQGYLTRKTNDS
jgi:RNA ligase